MKHQNLSAFLHNEKNHGVYIFTSDSCELCAQFQRDLSSYDTSSFTAVEVTKDEEIILSQMFNVQGFPFTVVFVENKIGLIKKGVLYQKQINDIFDFMKKNNIKTEQIKAPITQLTPVILELPSPNDTRWAYEYIAASINDCLKHNEAPLNMDVMFNNYLDNCNPIHISIMRKMKESWGLVARKTVVYTDLGVNDEMLEGITDAAARGREVEFRKLYEN